VPSGKKEKKREAHLLLVKRALAGILYVVGSLERKRVGKHASCFGEGEERRGRASKSRGKKGESSCTLRGSGLFFSPNGRGWAAHAAGPNPGEGERILSARGKERRLSPNYVAALPCATKKKGKAASSPKRGRRESRPGKKGLTIAKEGGGQRFISIP